MRVERVGGKLATLRLRNSYFDEILRHTLKCYLDHSRTWVWKEWGYPTGRNVIQYCRNEFLKVCYLLTIGCVWRSPREELDGATIGRVVRSVPGGGTVDGGMDGCSDVGLRR